MDQQPQDRVVVIDEDNASCSLVSRLLATLNYATPDCLSPDSADEAVKRANYDLAFIDITASRRGGIELAQRLRNKLPHCVTILMSCQASFDDAVEAMRSGAHDILRKPVDGHELALALNRYQEQKRLRVRVLQAEKQYVRLVQNIPVLVFSLRPDMSLAFVNQASQELLGYQPFEAVIEPRWLPSRLHPDDSERMLIQLAAAMDCRSPFTSQCRLIHRSGQTIHTLIKSISCSATEDEGPLLQGVILDITDRVLLEQALIQEEKLKTLQVISEEVAHEVRNPLTSIAGFATRLGRKHPESGETTGIILREARRLEKLLNRIRNYLNPVRVTQQACSMNTLLTECVHLLFMDLQKQGVWCVLDLSPELPQVFADPDLLSQVCVSLMLTSLREMPSDQVLTIRSFSSGGAVQVQFRHQVAAGAGSPDPEKLFMPFDQGGQSLGLALAYRLVQNMGGLLTFSMESGQSVFTASLPRLSREGGMLFSERRLAPSTSNVVRTSPRASVGECSFEELLDREWVLALRKREPIALILADVDHFESYIGMYGRKHAEEALQRIFEAIKSSLRRPADFATRLSEQQFAAVLPDTNEFGALIVAETLRQGVADQAILHEGARLGGKLTISVGVASFVPECDTNSLDLLAEASRSLYQAKIKGRNRVYAPGMKAEESSAGKAKTG
jgi:diguanylate cyclase (GGDEF)-like protein/PAS domain S-box-containing protein